MAFLDRDAIRNMDDNLKVERVEVPEWDGHVFVREISAHAQEVYEEATFDVDPAEGKVKMKSMANRRALYVVLCACDENGKAIFDVDDVEWLGQKQLSAVNRIYLKAQEINGVDLEAATKKSPAPAADSSTD